MPEHRTGDHSYEKAGTFVTEERCKVVVKVGTVFYSDAGVDRAIATGNTASVSKDEYVYWTTKCSFHLSKD